MLERIWWFVAGTVAGAVVVIRALGKTPEPEQLKSAAIRTGADVLDLGAKAMRPKRTG